MGRQRLRVRFVFGSGLHLRARIMGRALPLTGSEMLRLQMLERMRPFIPGSVDFGISFFGGRLLPFDRWLALQRPAVFVLSKNLAYALDADRIGKLRKKAVLVAVDHHDGDMSKIDLSRFDLHLATSHAADDALGRIFDEMAERGERAPKHALLLQSPDARLPRGDASRHDRLKPIYVGMKIHTVMPDAIADEIATFEVQTNLDMLTVLPQMPDYNFHYAVRPAPPDTLRRAYKPFTKGFTAAVLDSNILVNRADDDAVHFLSEDYPYLARSGSPEEIVELFRFAQQSYGSPEWARGLEIMRGLREVLEPENLAAQFMSIVKDIEG